MNPDRKLQSREGYDERAYLAALQKLGIAPREACEEGTYQKALQKLGLVPPVDRATIQNAYRSLAKQIHPDRFQNEEDKADATRSIQEINAAHAYATQHYRGYQLAERWGRTTRAQAAEGAPWQKWLFLPVTAVYALTTVGIAAPFLALARLVAPERRARWRERRIPSMAWRFWVLAGPHGATMALFATVEELSVKVWFGVSFLVMLSADIATLVTGDAHALRRPLSNGLLRMP